MMEKMAAAARAHGYRRNDMTEAGVKELIREKLLEAVAKARTTGGVSTMKDHFKNASSYNKKQAKANTAVSDAHNELARAAEARGDFSSAKSYRASADGHTAMAQAHQAHAEQLSTMANGGPDVWGLAGQTVDRDGKPVNQNNEKVAKGLTEEFFDRFYSGGAVDASGGLFGPSSAAGAEKLTKTQSASGGLF